MNVVHADVINILQNELVIIVAQWHHKASGILVNVGSSNGLLPDGTKTYLSSMRTSGIYPKLVS